MTTKTKDRRPTEAERDRRRADEREQMREAVEALQTSEGWQRWLRLRRHFHSYSFRNQLLIALQCPEATRVAGFRRWLELGYAVRKGEHGIKIAAPCPPSKKAVERWRRVGADPEDKPRTYFRLVAVFDTLSRVRARRPRSLEAWSGGWRRWRPTAAGKRRRQAGGARRATSACRRASAGPVRRSPHRSPAGRGPHPPPMVARLRRAEGARRPAPGGP